MNLTRESIALAGAGPTGSLLAILLERRGASVTLYDSRPDPRQAAQASGRSINLALADRGIHALEHAGVLGQIRDVLVPMRGRLVHQPDGSSSFQAYGQRPHEIIYSISRAKLNQALLDVALCRPRIRASFEHRLEDADFATRLASFRDLHSGTTVQIPMRPLLAADGAGSTVRRHMAALGLIEAHESDLEHGYKELTIPAGPDGSYRMEREALHIWPRGGYMLIALPNRDGSFTASLFLPRSGPVSFASLDDEAAIGRFLSESFPDARALMPDCVAEFRDRPTGFLGTVHAREWHVRDTAALIGDAAHAIVPFHGQGMNCCFEDCVEFDALLGSSSSWQETFERFHAARKPNTDAIAQMALENYLEMRESVADPRFRLQQSLALELERRFPRRFIPRYSMVMFHHEIPYRTALERGAVQSELLAELTQNAATLADVNYERAAREIESRLAPLPATLSSVTKL